MILISHHPEITEQLKSIVKVVDRFKKYEKSLGKDAANEKKKLSAAAYYAKLLKFNRQSGGTLERDIQKVTLRLGRAMPEFTLMQGASAKRLQEYAETTGSKSHRMNQQLALAKILKVKDLFRIESDIFDPQKLDAIKILLKGLK